MSSNYSKGVIITGISLILNLHAPAPTSANEIEKVSGIAVAGECLAKVTQDRGSIVVASSVVARTAKEASERATRAHEAVKAAVKKLELKDGISETAGYSVFEECSYNNQGKRECRGYRARMATRFETSEISRLGDIIAVASEQSSEEVSELQTIVSPALMQRERESCLENATRNARAKAAMIAKGAGVKLGRVLSIREAGEDMPISPIPRGFAMTRAVAEEASAAPSIEAKPLNVLVTVSVVFAIE
jgi:uncharacterized protein YggE